MVVEFGVSRSQTNLRGEDCLGSKYRGDGRRQIRGVSLV